MGASYFLTVRHKDFEEEGWALYVWGIKQQQHAMKNQTATEYIFNTPTARFNAGYQDALGDIQHGRDRRLIEVGKTFCLPPHNKMYCKGYRQAHEDRLSGLVVLGLDGPYTHVDAAQAKSA